MEDIEKLADIIAKADETERFKLPRIITKKDRGRTGDVGELRQSGLSAESTFAGGKKFTKRDLVRTKSISTKTVSTSKNLRQKETSAEASIGMMTNDVGAENQGDGLDYDEIESVVADSLEKYIADFWDQVI
jgi:hypothetical protein